MRQQSYHILLTAADPSTCTDSGIISCDLPDRFCYASESDFYNQQCCATCRAAAASRTHLPVSKYKLQTDAAHDAASFIYTNFGLLMAQCHSYLQHLITYYKVSESKWLLFSGDFELLFKASLKQLLSSDDCICGNNLDLKCIAFCCSTDS